MKSPVFRSIILPLLCLLAVLLFSQGLDTLIQAQITRNTETFALTSVILVIYSFTVLLLAAALLALFWLLLNRLPRNRLTGVIYLLAGLFIVFYPTLYFFEPFTPLISSFSSLLLSRGSYLFITGGFVSMMGFVLLFSVKHKKT